MMNKLESVKVFCKKDFVMQSIEGVKCEFVVGESYTALIRSEEIVMIFCDTGYKVTPAQSLYKRHFNDMKEHRNNTINDLLNDN